MFVHRHSDGKDQFDRVIGAVRASPEIYSLGRDGRGEERFTSRHMIRVEVTLEKAGDRLAGSMSHGVSSDHRNAALGSAERQGLVLSGGQRDAFEHVTGKEGLSCVIGYAGGRKVGHPKGAGGVGREGFTVRGAALSGIAAENLEGGSGFQSRTLASLERQWEQGGRCSPAVTCW